MKRSVTRGNESVDYTKIREDLNNLPAGLKATLRNAVPANGRNPTREDAPDSTKHIDTFKLNKLSNIISNNINAVTDLRAITPYIDKADLIWRTILLSPNGKQDKILTYDTQPGQYKCTALFKELTSIWDGYYTNDYKIEKELGSWVSDIWFNTGSVALFNLSRPGLDYLINGSEIIEDKKEGRTGAEAFLNYRNFALEELKKEFIKENDKYVAINKGNFVRDPHNKDGVNKAQVSGLETLLGSHRDYAGKEFNIFPEEEKEFNITLTDNPAILYMQRFNETVRHQNIDTVVGAESFDTLITKALEKTAKKTVKRDENDPLATTSNLTDEQVSQLVSGIYKERNVSRQSIQYVKPNDSLSVAPYGRGISFHVPSDAVVPIHFKGQIGEECDYILLLDEEGNFLHNTYDDLLYQSVDKTKTNITTKNSSGGDNQLISNLRKVQQGSACDFDMSDFAQLATQAIIKRFMAAVVSNRGESLSITLDEATVKIFLGRMFKGQGVRCLYVPGEALTYMAIKYNRLGIGQSLTQLAKNHIARLAAFDLADALANLEAAQPHTEMRINIKEGDGNPANTVAIARAAYFESNPRLHNLLSTAQLSLPAIVDSLRESSLTVKVDASENQHMPTPDIEMSQYEKNNFKPVDDTSRQQVLNQIANYFSLPKSWLDISDDQNNFKIEAVTENEMVFRQAGVWQDVFADHIMDFQRKHARVNGELLNRLVNCILENEKLWQLDSKETLPGETKEAKVKLLLTAFFNSIYCYLPTPTSTETTNKLKDSLDAVNQLVTAWEEMSGSKQLMDRVVKNLGIETEGFSSDDIKAYIKATFLMEAFKRFNLPMPFDEIINEGKGGGIASLVTNIIQQRVNVGEFIATAVKDVAESDTKMIKTHSKKIQASLEKLVAVMGGDHSDDEEGLVQPSDSESSLPASEETGDDLEPLGGEEGELTGDDQSAGDENNEEEQNESSGTTDDNNEESDKPDDQHNPFS